MYKQETAGKDNGTEVFQFPMHFSPPAPLLHGSLDIPAFCIFTTL